MKTMIAVAAFALTVYSHTDDRIRSFPNPARYEPRIEGEEPFPVIVKGPGPLLGLSGTVIQAWSPYVIPTDDAASSGPCTMLTCTS
jgi:hypothetical protein